MQRSWIPKVVQFTFFRVRMFWTWLNTDPSFDFAQDRPGDRGGVDPLTVAVAFVGVIAIVSMFKR